MTSIKTTVDNERGVVSEKEDGNGGFVINSQTVLNSSLVVSSSATLNEGLFVSGSTNLSGSLVVSSSATLNSGLAVSGEESTLEGGIYVDSLTFLSSSVRWDDLRVPLTVTKLGGVKDPTFSQFQDDGAGSTGVYAYSFVNPGQEQEVFFSVQLPHGWKLESTLYPHVHWAPSDGGSGDVTWGLEYTWASRNEIFGTTTIISGSYEATGAKKQTLSSFPTIDGTGQGISSILMCRIFRSGSGDTYGSAAWLLEIDFHYQIDTIGSATETAKE